MQLVSRLREGLGVTVSLRDVFAAPTVAKLAVLIEGRSVTLKPERAKSFGQGDVEDVVL
jgi:hypothetical protein